MRDFTVAMARNDVDAVLAFLADDVQWNIVGPRRQVGHEAVAGFLQERAGQVATRLALRQVITHGRDAAAHGVLTMAGGTVVAFCDVYAFAGASKSARIRQISSYVIAGVNDVS